MQLSLTKKRNIIWMNIWIEKSNEVYLSLSWSEVVKFIRRTHLDNDCSVPRSDNLGT